MASPVKLLGYVLQFSGMAIMFFGFVYLVAGIQKTVSHVTQTISQQSGVLPTSGNATCDPKEDEFCGVDLSKEGATEQLFSKRVYQFIMFLGAGLALVFIGLLMRAGEEIGGFLARLKGKEEDRLRIPVGRWRGGI